MLRKASALVLILAIDKAIGIGTMSAKQKYTRLTILIVCLCLSALTLSACSDSKKEDTSSKNDLSFSGGSKKSGESTDTSLGNIITIKSETAAKSFAYKIAASFVSTDVKDDKTLKSFISSSADPAMLTNLIQSNNLDINPSISFSPVGVTVDSYNNGQARIAVLGVSFVSTKDGVYSIYKEVLFDLNFETSWKVVGYNLSDVPSQLPDGSLDPSFLQLLDGYVVPSDEFINGDTKIITRSIIHDENGSPTTTLPVFPGE